MVCKIKTAPCQVMHCPRPALPLRPPPPASARVPTDSRERSWAAAPPTIVLKDAHGNKQVLEGHSREVNVVKANPNKIDMMASGSYDEKIIIWKKKDNLWTQD